MSPNERRTRSPAPARAALVALLAGAALMLSAVGAFAQPPRASAGAGSTVCPTFPCWVVNTAGLYSVQRQSKHGRARVTKRFANASTYPVLQADKVPPGDPDWGFYTTPPARVTKAGARRTEQFWNFQSLWLSCPPPGSPGWLALGTTLGL